MQRVLFHKIHDIKNKLLIIIHADKNKCSKRDKFFSSKTSSFFSSPSLWKLKKKKQQKVTSWCIFTGDLIAKHKSK